MKSWLCNVQVGQHVVEWLENMLPDATHTAAGFPTTPPHADLLVHCTASFSHQFRHFSTVFNDYYTNYGENKANSSEKY